MLIAVIKQNSWSTQYLYERCTRFAFELLNIKPWHFEFSSVKAYFYNDFTDYIFITL